ncbi:MAG: methicillin resistance protein [uncultured bacterium]|nr:MAG: methicillin resistance protein [uncultured bacterium]HBR71792.1 hypothetical protein [Candidatus Moranbacteria bacterium]
MENFAEKYEIFRRTSAREAFLQSDEWRNFQEKFGQKTFCIDEKNGKSNCEENMFRASIISHRLPIVGEYFYVPRGPIFDDKNKNNLECLENFRKSLQYLIWMARENGAGWVRIDPQNEKNFSLIKEAIKEISCDEKNISLRKAPHNMQPGEIFEINIEKNEAELLSEMKTKTRYNIRLAEKKGVKIICSSQAAGSDYVDDFLRLTKEMAKRNGIVTHPDQYYRKMIENLPEDMLKIYVAEFAGKIIAANLILFFGDSATYLHGASSDENREVMAPFLLQWKQILDAKERGCKTYDLGGVKTNDKNNSWEGITRFKMGFSTKTEPIKFPGSYDIVINPYKYQLYRTLQKVRSFWS